MKKQIFYFIFFILLNIFFFQASAYSWPIAHSGVTKCYDNVKEIPCPKPGERFYGQSGNYIINPKSYTKLDDRGNDLPDDADEWFMVRDNVTGLIWEIKQANDGNEDYSNPHDADNTYTWYDSNSETNYGYTGTYNDGRNTERFVQQINESNFGGFGDWRLPSIKELASIVDLFRTRPASEFGDCMIGINEKYFRNNMKIYWSSTSNATLNYKVWGVFFDCIIKDIIIDKPLNIHHVRAVRGTIYRSFDHLIMNDDKTVTDTKTGLIWSVDTSEIRLNWEDALKYFETFSLTDNSDWRLPEREELRSIVDYTSWDPSIDLNFFKYNIKSSIYWSSTFTFSTHPWSMKFKYGNSETCYYKSICNVRAVRGGQCVYSGHVLIQSPMQAAILITGRTISITWDTANINSKVKITLSRQGGKADTFETITPETENDGHYDWTITGPPSPNCMLKIEPISFPYSGTQQSFFTIKNPDMIVNTNVQSNFTISGPESFNGKGHSYTIYNALPGTYTITYAPDACWQTPAKESQSLTYWGTLTFEGVYGEIPADPIQNLRADREIKTWTGNNQITIQWKPINQCLKEYAFVWDQSENTDPVDIITGTKHQTISPPLGNGSDHWFHIKSINIHGNASETAHIGPFYIDTSLLPDAPENLIVKTTTADSVQLVWLPTLDNSVYYTIYRSQMEEGVYYPIQSEPINYFDAVVNGFWDTNISTGTTYFYKIKSWRAGLESLNFSNTVCFTSPDRHPTFDLDFLSSKHQIVPAGTDITFQMLINKTEAFQGHLDLWCEKLPEHVVYALSVNHQAAKTRAEDIQLLPATVRLTIKTGSATSLGNHQFDLICLNVDNVTGYEQKKWTLDLTVVPLTGGIFVDIDPYRIHKNDQGTVYGRIYHFDNNQPITLEAWKNSQKYKSITLKTRLGGWFEDHEWIKHFDPGVYTIRAIWENTQTLPFTDETRSLIIEKVRPQLFLSSQDNQVPEIDKDFALTIEHEHTEGYETIKLVLYPPGQGEQSILDLSTDENGCVNISKQFFKDKGKHTFKAYFMGNESSIGCESNEYPVMVGNTGYAILVGGGVASSNNTYWNVTKKLLTDAYLDFKRMGFTDDMIYLMINSQIIDITGDDIKDDIVDQDQPSVSKLKEIIETQYTDLLTENDTLYLYMMGHGTDNATFKVFGADQYITSTELNTALTNLQDNTNCTVVIILECCYSGAFINTLRHPNRLIITSAGEEAYNTDASGNISLSRYLFPRLCSGDSIQKAFEYARMQLINKRYPSPQLDDYTHNNLLAATTYLPEKLQWRQPEISSVDLYPILDGKETLAVRLTIQSMADSISKVWAQVIPPNALILSGSETIHFQETRLHHDTGTCYSGDITGFSHDGVYTVIFYAQNTSMEVSEPVQWIVRATNIGRKKDFNQDGQFNMKDIIVVLKSICGMDVLNEADLSDAVYLIQEIGFR